MKICTVYYIFLCFLDLHKCIFCFELLTATVVGLGSVVVNKVVKHTYCKLQECCTENEIPADFHSKYKISK